MAINNQTVKLYWVSSIDHDHDWFVFAANGREAQAFHERVEGLRGPHGDSANSRLIVSRVTLKKYESGPPPCQARFEDLYQIGLEAGTIAGRRKGRFSGEIFQNGILEAIIELGRARLALENGCHETGPRLVHS